MTRADDHPSIDIDVVVDDRDIDLIAAGIDVALLMGRLADSPVTARKNRTVPKARDWYACYFAARGVPQIPADLLAHQAIVYEQRDGGASSAFRHGTSETTVTVSSRLRVSAGEGVREGVLAGLAFAVASEWQFAPELKSGTVKAVLTDWLLPPVDLWGRCFRRAGRRVPRPGLLRALSKPKCRSSGFSAFGSARE